MNVIISRKQNRGDEGEIKVGNKMLTYKRDFREEKKGEGGHTVHLLHLLSQIGTNTSRHTGEGRRRDAHSLGGHKDGLVPKCRHAHDLQSLSGHFLRECIPDVPVRIRLDADGLRFCLCCKACRVRTRLGFDASALGRGLGGCDD